MTAFWHGFQKRATEIQPIVPAEPPMPAQDDSEQLRRARELERQNQVED